jgi:hypothetical protein
MPDRIEDDVGSAGSENMVAMRYLMGLAVAFAESSARHFSPLGTRGIVRLGDRQDKISVFAHAGDYLSGRRPSSRATIFVDFGVFHENPTIAGQIRASVV